MADIYNLTDKVLQRLGVLGAEETSSDVDKDKALEGLKAAHYALSGEDLLRWTMSDIPDEMIDAYVSIAAFNVKNDFNAPVGAEIVGIAMKQVRNYVMAVKADAPAPVEFF